MRFQAAIFDMDGTIILTEDLWQQSAIKLIETKCNIRLSDELKNKVIEQMAGAGLEKSAQIIQKTQQELLGGKLKCDSIETIKNEYKKCTLTFFSPNIPFVSGFKNFHAKLSAHQIPSAIATNCPLDILQETNTLLHLDQYFSTHMYSVSHIHNICKPDPAIYLYAAEKLGVEAKNCVAFEDSIPGIAAAKAAGMFCVGIKNNNHPEFVALADMHVESYDQIQFDQLFS